MANYKPTGTPGIYVTNTGRLVYRVKIPDAANPKKSKWTWVPSSYVAGQEDVAAKALEQAQRTVVSAQDFTASTGRKTTVAAYAEERFFPRRRKVMEDGRPLKRDWKRDEARLRTHIFPFKIGGVELGNMALRDVRHSHVRDCIFAMRATRQEDKTGFASRTVFNAYFVLKALFRDAEVDDLCSKSPCMLTDMDLGKKRDKVEGWRETAVYEREELQTLISSPVIPPDRQLWYALEGIAAMRLMEVARAKFEHHYPNDAPLGRLLIPDTKTGFPRNMPMHPTLGAMLAEWRMGGYFKMFGRHPQPGDLILPTSPPVKPKELPAGLPRTQRYVWRRLRDDLKALGMRHRRSHDLRATMIDLAMDDGANAYHLEACTHTPKSAKAFDLYRRINWKKKCAAVAAFNVERKTDRGELIPLRVAANGPQTSEDTREESCPRVSPVSSTTDSNSEKPMRAEGIEPAVRTSTAVLFRPSEGSKGSSVAGLTSSQPDRPASNGMARQRTGDTGTRADSRGVTSTPSTLTVLRELLEKHQRTEPHHEDLCKLCQRAEAAIAREEGGR